MDNDLPEDRNGLIAAAYAELAHQAKLRVNALEQMQREDFVPEVEMALDEPREAANRLQRLADLYAERYYLSTGYHAKP